MSFSLRAAGLPGERKMLFILRMYQSLPGITMVRRKRRRAGGQIAIPTSVRNLSEPVRRSRRTAPADANGGGLEFRVNVGGLVFLVREGRSLRWRNFMTERRCFRVMLERPDGNDDDVVLEAIRAEEAMEQLMRKILNEVRRLHKLARRPATALAMLTLDFAEIEWPMNSNIGQLFSESLETEFMSMVKMLIVSKKAISIDDKFEFLVTIVDHEDRDDLIWAAGGPNWDFERPENWNLLDFSKKKSIYLMPIHQSDHRYADCCVLAAIAFCMRFNRHQRLKAEGQAGDFDVLKPIRWELGAARQTQFRIQKARDKLKWCMDQLVSDYDLDVEAFRSCDVTSDVFRREVTKLGINLVIYKDSCNYQKFVQLPETYMPEKETVHVLLVDLLPKSTVLHSAAITIPAAYHSASLGNGSYCPRCSKHFSTRFVSQHRCIAGKTCVKCKRVKHEDGMYRDAEVDKTLCFDHSLADGNLQCPRCKKHFRGNECLRAHKLYCNSATLFCEDCKMTYRRGYEHVCGGVYCPVCDKYYVEDEMASDARHHCPMKKPRPPKRFDKIAFFDMETVCNDYGDHHRCNAVGLSFEEPDKKGWFSDIYFYDAEMEMPQDSVLVKENFYFKYWPDSLEQVQELWEQKKRKKPLKFGRSSLTDAEELTREVENTWDDGDGCPAFADSLRFAFEEAVEAAADEDEDEEEDAEGDEDDHFTPSTSDSAMGQFVDFILDEKFRGYSLIAHNASRQGRKVNEKGFVYRALFFQV